MRRRVRNEVLAGEVRPLAVEHSQGVALVAHAAVGTGLAEAVGVVGLERLQVLGPAGRVADAVDGEGEAPQPQRVREAPAEVDDLRVDGRVTVADGLDAELVVLAQAAGLGALVAEDGAEVVHAHGLRAVVHAVLEIGAADGRGALGPQGDLLAAAIGEGVGLLLDDVGALADAALEEPGVLEDGGVDLPVAEPAGLLAGGGRDVVPVGLVFGKDVLGAPGKAELHGGFLRSLG